MRIINAVFLVLAAFLFFACNNILGDRPEKVFDVTTLNANLVSSKFTRLFNELKAQKSNNSLLIPDESGKYRNANSYKEYVEKQFHNQFTQYIDRVKALKPTDETKPLIDYSIDMFTYANEIYNTDFISIAEMLDAGKPDEEVNNAITELETTKGLELDKKREVVVTAGLAYAEKHGIEVKTYNTPW